jgi:hypothetical protein
MNFRRTYYAILLASLNFFKVVWKIEQNIILQLLNAVQKSKNHCGANDLSVTVISNRKCNEKRVLFAPQWFFDF